MNSKPPARVYTWRSTYGLPGLLRTNENAVAASVRLCDDLRHFCIAFSSDRPVSPSSPSICVFVSHLEPGSHDISYTYVNGNYKVNTRITVLLFEIPHLHAAGRMTEVDGAPGTPGGVASSERAFTARRVPDFARLHALEEARVARWKRQNKKTVTVVSFCCCSCQLID